MILVYANLLNPSGLFYCAGLLLRFVFFGIGQLKQFFRMSQRKFRDIGTCQHPRHFVDAFSTEQRLDMRLCPIGNDFLFYIKVLITRLSPPLTEDA